MEEGGRFSSPFAPYAAWPFPGSEMRHLLVERSYQPVQRPREPDSPVSLYGPDDHQGPTADPRSTAPQQQQQQQQGAPQRGGRYPDYASSYRMQDEEVYLNLQLKQKDIKSEPDLSSEAASGSYTCTKCCKVRAVNTSQTEVTWSDRIGLSHKLMLHSTGGGLSLV